MGLKEEITKELAKSTSMDEVRSSLIRRGYLEKDIDEGLKGLIKANEEERSRNDNLLSTKELFDRIGYGFASQQFINIMFMLTGASFFTIGLFNGIKTALTSLLSGFLHEYSKIKHIGKSMISASGIIYGFSFLGMTIALVVKKPWVFALSLIIGALGIIAHGDLYVAFSSKILKNERRKNFLRFISYFGIVITAIALLLAGFVMELIPINGYEFNISLEFLNLAEPIGFKLYGYLLAFEITAIMFILSGYLLSKIEEKKEEAYFSGFSVGTLLKDYFMDSFKSARIFTKNRKVYLLTLAIMMTTIIQVIGNSYYGIFIYEQFKDQLLKGFFNVSVIFTIALIASIIGTVFTKTFSKSIGEAPMLVFGTLLIALMPLTMYYNPHLYAIALATALSVIGGAIVGVAQGMIAERLMDADEQKKFFSSISFISIIPILLLVTLGAFVAQTIGLSFLFLSLSMALVGVVMPLYFLIVVIVDQEYKKE